MTAAVTMMAMVRLVIAGIEPAGIHIVNLIPFSRRGNPSLRLEGRAPRSFLLCSAWKNVCSTYDLPCTKLALILPA